VYTVQAILQLARVDSSILAFLSLFIPIYARTHDLTVSIERAIPLLFICMCTFIANDLDDLERDQINHPERPLPKRRLSLTVAALLFFICLALALFLTKRYVDERIAFWYYGLATVSISYGYVVEWLPSIKAPYVAVAISVPVLIVAASYPAEHHLYVVAVAGFMLALGRELCMDIADRAGDVRSAMHRIPESRLAVTAFISQTIGWALLVLQIRRTLDLLAAVFLAIVLLIAGIWWFRAKKYKMARRLMKLTFLVGMYFLL
jgi:geranylgeranylglycerol-phosphate geranylgeranyltransferase